MRPEPVDELDELEPDELDDEPVRDRRPRDVVELYELPPLFAKEGTDNAPTTRPIVWAYVFKKQGAQMGFIDFHPIEDMADIAQLRDAYGAGVYAVQGRGANKKDTVKQVTVTIGGVERMAQVVHAPPSRAELDLSKIASAAVAVVTPLLTLWERMNDRSETRRREEREAEDRRRADEREREDARQTTFMQTITSLMGARMTDMEALLKAQHAAGGAGSSGGKRIAEAYQEGQADALELIRAVKSEGLGGEDSESKILGIVESFLVGKKKADEDLQQQNGAPDAAAH